MYCLTRLQLTRVHPASMYESIFSFKLVHLFQSEIVFFRIHELQHTSFSEHMKCNTHQLSIFFSKTNQIALTKNAYW